MKGLLIAAMVTAQPLVVAAPAYAAELGPAQQHETGAFGGFRFRVPLDGSPREREIRAGLTLAPALHSFDSQGAARIRVGEGIEVGYRPGRKLSLSLAGQEIGRSRLGAGQDESADEKGRVPTRALIAGGVAIVAGVGAALFYDALKDASE